MIQFSEVSLAFAGTLLLDKISFSCQKGERCGLIGRNGSGKSTLFKLITKEIEPDKGQVLIPKGYRIGYLQQQIAFVEKSLVKEAARGLTLEQEGLLYKAEKILFGLGFAEKDLQANPAHFSGGFQLRLHLAKVLIAEPDCLLLDEPTNYLDILSLRWLTQFLSKWRGEFILISHDRDFMDHVTTHTMGIHRRQLMKIKGSSIDLFQQILVQEEVYEKNRIKTEKRRAELEGYIERFGAKASKASQAQSKQKMLDRQPVLDRLNQLEHLSFCFPYAPFPGRRMIEVSDISFSFTGNSLIHKFSVEILHGERVAIIGKNGRGKSTLLSLIAGFLDFQQGSRKSADNLKMGYFGQTHIDRLSLEQTIEDEILSANPLLNNLEVRSIAGAMMFSGDAAKKKISLLSGGERSRVLLGKILAKPCNLLLLDEPTHHLDIESIEALIEALEDFEGAVVIVTHSELILRRLQLNKIVICEDAKQTPFLGNYDEFLNKVGWEEEKEGGFKKEESVRKKERQERAKTAELLQPLKKQIKELEMRLSILESLQKAEQIELESPKVSPETLRSLAARLREIEKVEAQLYALYEELEQRKVELS